MSPSNKPLLSFTPDTLMIDVLRSISYWSFRAHRDLIDPSLPRMLLEQAVKTLLATEDQEEAKARPEIDLIQNDHHILWTLETLGQQLTRRQKDELVQELPVVAQRGYQTPEGTSLPAKWIESFTRRHTLKESEGDWKWIHLVFHPDNVLIWADDGQNGYSQHTMELSLESPKSKKTIHL